ncbi:hypothetical protein Mapa_003460 [Marchantia paleacea]|nr:hypothetical protein Mapa_003460 [Marchantia paleacea]
MAPEIFPMACGKGCGYEHSVDWGKCLFSSSSNAFVALMFFVWNIGRFLLG